MRAPEHQPVIEQIRCRLVRTASDGTRERADVVPRLLERNAWHTALELAVSVPRGAVEVELAIEIPCMRAWCLTAARELDGVGADVTPPFPVGTFVVTESEEGIRKWSFPWAPSPRLRRRGASVIVETTLRSVRRCGLSLWGDDKLAPEPAEWTLRLTSDALDSLDDCLWLEPYPKGARAVICLTDHADYDSAEKLAALADLFVANDVRITKTVFPQSEPSGHKREPGLDVPEFVKVVDRLHEHGTEIAYHGFGPRVNAPSIEECERRAERMQRYGVVTWTDHGSGSYLLSRGGTLPGGESLLAFLGRYGVVNYWSYADLWDNPFRSLDCWRRRERSSSIRDGLTGLRPAAAAGPKSLAYLLTHGAKNALGYNGLETLRAERFAPRVWRTVARARERTRELRRAPTLVYGLDGTGFSLGSSAPWVFDTLLLNHPALQLSAKLIDELIRASGLLIAHTYLASEKPYGFGHTLRRGAQGPKPEPAFVDAVRHLGQRQAAGDVATTSFAELRRSLESFGRNRLVRTQAGWRLEVAGDGPAVVSGARGVVDRLCAGAERRDAGRVGVAGFRSSRELRESGALAALHN
jgi:hypothetical protein